MLDRRDAVAAVVRARERALIVTGLGSPTWDVAAIADSPLNFYLWGAMGAAAMVGLGLALAQPSRRVVVITGDGELLMGLGSLATIGVERPSNLSVVVIDNERYGETGMQPSHTARGVDLAAIARGAGIEDAATVLTARELETSLAAIYGRTGPVLRIVKVQPNQPPLRAPLRDGAHLKNRFREALLGDAAFGDP